MTCYWIIIATVTCSLHFVFVVASWMHCVLYAHYMFLKSKIHITELSWVFRTVTMLQKLHLSDIVLDLVSLCPFFVKCRIETDNVAWEQSKSQYGEVGHTTYITALEGRRTGYQKGKAGCNGDNRRSRWCSQVKGDNQILSHLQPPEPSELTCSVWHSSRLSGSV